MSLQEKINADLVIAMKERNKLVIDTLRMVKAQIQDQEKVMKKTLEDIEVVAIVEKQIKTRNEAIKEFEKGHRGDLISKNKLEIETLNKYMPEQLSEEEIANIINENINEDDNIGTAMKKIIPLVKGKADMSKVNKLIKEKIN